MAGCISKGLDCRAQLLLEASCLIASKLDLGELLKTILELGSKVVGSERTSLFLLDEKTQCLYFDVALGLGPEVSSLRFPLGQGIAGTVAQERKPLIINDARADPRWSSKADAKTGFVTRSLLAVPMVHQGKLIGVLEAINKTAGGFDETDVSVFDSLAAQAAVAIENARLFSAVREERAMLDAMFSQMTDGAILSDAKGAILIANNTARKLLCLDEGRGTLEAALSGMTLRPPLGEILSAASMLMEAEREKPTKLVLEGVSTPIALSAPGGRGDAMAGKFWVFRNVTEDRRKESLKRTFLSLMSHKLKTPLASITGYAELLTSDPPAALGEMDLKALTAILRQGRKLSSLVNKLLNFTTLEDEGFAFKAGPLPVADAAGDAVSAMAEWLQENGASVKIETGGCLVVADRYLLTEVLKNLIENAVKFDTKPAKEVAVAAWAEGPGTEGPGAEGGLTHIAVHDKGPGIPPEDQEQVFSQFHQIEESFTGQMEGAGLGLAYVKKVVERLGGSVRLESSLGQGTVVTVSLPAPRAP
ncbi:MAG: GAF domain-containing sensor histidine kinase [Elusimicrobiota bacterium]|jgi:signal transduction histidine kinase